MTHPASASGTTRSTTMRSATAVGVVLLLAAIVAAFALNVYRAQ